MKTPESRFWRFVAKTDECWLWTGHIKPNGYGQFWGPGKMHAHHFLVGKPPKGLEWDHLCHDRDETCFDCEDCVHRRCVRPEHLELVTKAENLRRGHRKPVTHCVHGHAYDESNTIINQKGAHVCRICSIQRNRDYRIRVKERAI
jgi:hypothetical protein